MMREATAIPHPGHYREWTPGTRDKRRGSETPCIKPIGNWVWLDPGTTLDVDHGLTNEDMVC